MPDCWRGLARFILYSLAVVRVTYMLWREDGPWDILDWVRSKVGVYYEMRPYHDEPTRMARNVVARLFNCPLCLSFWLSAVAVGLFLLRLRILDIGAAVLGMAGLVMLVLMVATEND
jgi:hypothetical protein